MPFPSPIGGIPYHIDLAPSVVFAIAYACLLPLVAFRIWDKESRTVTILGNIIFAVERIVAFSLRAVQSTNEGKRFSLSLTAYIQSDLALGYIGIASDLSNLLRTLLITPTFGSDMYVQSTEAESRYRFWLSSAKLADTEADGPLVQGGETVETRKFPGKPPEGIPDHPKTRFWIRRVTKLISFAFLPATITGVIASSNFGKSVNGGIDEHYIMTMRYASSGVALFCTLLTIGAALWGYFSLPRVNKRGCVIISAVSVLASIIAIYRLCVMHHTMESLRFTGPGSFSTPADKAVFYIFHVLPEWLSTLLLLAFNTRRIFSTGVVGDWRWTDETPKELEKRLKGEAVHREKIKLRQLEAPKRALPRK